MQGIISGLIHKEVELRTARKGNPFATFKIRESVARSPMRFWQCISFSEPAIETLKEMAVGEPVAVAGAITCEIYNAPDKPSENRINWNVVVEAVLSTRPQKDVSDAS